MATPTATSIATIIQNGISGFNLQFEVFDREQVKERRHYPSIEVLKFTPQASNRTKQKDIQQYAFKIRIYQKIQSSNDEESANQEQAEQQVITLLQAQVLQDPRIIGEMKNWNRQQVREGHPYHFLSELTVMIRNVYSPTLPLDGILTFDATNSSVDNPPPSNYTYVACYNTLISDGYREISEYVTSNPDGDKLPVNYAGGFNGRFISNLVVNQSDIGTTGDKLNNLRNLRTNGEKPEIYFIYVNQTDETPSPSTITESGFKVRVDSIDRVYNADDNVIFRITGKVVKPGGIVV